MISTYPFNFWKQNEVFKLYVKYFLIENYSGNLDFKSLTYIFISFEKH